MGIFNLFRKPKLEVIEQADLGAADEVIDYALNLIEDRQGVQQEISEINRIRKLPVGEREIYYLSVYLRLERFLLLKKPAQTKEYFSRKALKRQEEFNREHIRKAIREKLDISTLGDNFKVLFLNEPKRSEILFEIMAKRLIRIAPSQIKDKIEAILLKETSEFRSRFLSAYRAIIEAGTKEMADKIMLDVYNFADQYGIPLNSAAVQALPKLNSKSASAAAAYGAVDYALSLFSAQDLIRPNIEKINGADFMNPEEKEKVYFESYLELEKLAAEHAPPAVKKKITVQELRVELRNSINVEQLEHKFRILFLDDKCQVIELFALLYEKFLQHLVIFWNRIDLQKFAAEEIKGSALEAISELCIEKDRISFEILESGIRNLPKNKALMIIHDLSAFLLAVYKKSKEAGGDANADKAVNDAFLLLKGQYGAIPVFNEFIRSIPQGVLNFQKRLLLSPIASEKVARFIIDALQKESISEHIKSFEEAKKLPPERQTEEFFKVYLSLQSYIFDNRPSIKGKEIDMPELKEKIRRIVDIRDLEDKFQLLFLTRNETLVKLARELVKECINTFIDRKALIEAEKDLLKKEKMLKDVKIDDEGAIDFEPFLIRLNGFKKDKNKVLEETLSKVVFVIYERSKGILGELSAKKLFETAYAFVQRKYGANLLAVLKLIPKGVLEAEKFELLGKEEIEKTAKEMVKIDTLKGEFMNIAAHELKTPLVPIISYIEMLLDDKRIPKDAKEKLKICLSSAKREADLVSDILDISKLESGTLKLEMENADIAGLLKEIGDGLSPAVKQKGIYFKMDVPSKLPIVYVDRRRLMQVVSNLINNATKFTEKGGITLKARAQGKDVLVSVEDTGMGISKENLKKLFTKFFQVDSTARRKQGGTGLGLAICKGIIEGHKGKIWAESVLGKGTSFNFTIPCIAVKGERVK